MMMTSSCLADYLVVSCEGGGRSVIDGGGIGGTGGRAPGDGQENEAVAATPRRDDNDDDEEVSWAFSLTDILKDVFGEWW